MQTTRTRASLTTVTTLAALVSAAGCGVAPPQLNCSASFGTTDAAQKLRAFIDATTSFTATATELDATLLRECTALATDLGATAAELAATSSMTATQVACTRAAALIEQEIRAVRATSGVTVFVETTPPACRVEVDAYQRCVAACDVRFTPGMSDLRCEGGELRGSCMGSCTGQCAVNAAAMCTGSCEGTCTGSCGGTCSGTCEGMCATRDATGACNGTCMGTCRGTCSAMCTGSCTGQCVAMASAQCTGECRGMCSVAFTEPRCTGRVVPPMADVDCAASCDARINATATCTRGEVAVRINGDVGMLQTRANALSATLIAHYGAVLQTARQLERLVLAGQAVIESAQRVPGAVQALGVAAGACAVQSANDIRLAVPKVQVSVQVSVSVSTSVAAR
ncbi:MAG: hypothetical protein Q8Q09_26115 [Deltaproteobacteria bacterium]|nr:hypothetical protein [Deltaproteobacteria bacterium]